VYPEGVVRISVTGTFDVEEHQENLFPLLSPERVQQTCLLVSQWCPRADCPVTSLFGSRAGGIAELRYSFCAGCCVTCF